MTKTAKFAAISGAVILTVAALLAFPTLRSAVRGGLDPTDPAVTLADIEQTVSKRYAVSEIREAELTPALSSPDTVVFDVREPDEYAQSHIPGAVRVDPGTSAEEFLARHGERLDGKRVVFYCAVGVRSGIMAQRTEKTLMDRGVRSVQNLRGGIFRWHANGGPLTSTGADAASVHPYDSAWGQLLSRTLAFRDTTTPLFVSPRPQAEPARGAQ